jgi:hypothetical protein
MDDFDPFRRQPFLVDEIMLLSIGDCDDSVHPANGSTFCDAEGRPAVEVPRLLTDDHIRSNVHTPQEVWNPEQDIAVAQAIENIHLLSQCPCQSAAYQWVEFPSR